MRGPLLLLAGIALFTLLDTNSKLLSGGYGVGQVVALRYVVVLAFCGVAFAARPGALGPLRIRRPRPHLLRAAAMMVSSGCFFLGFRHLPLAEGYLVFFTAPFLTLALAAAALRERVSPAAWAWCGVGFAGVLLAVAPKLGAGGSAWSFAAVLLGTLAYAVTQTVNRALRADVGIARILVWPALLGVLLYGPLALHDWVAPPPLDLARLLANGVIAGAATVLIAAAFRHADAARLGPLNFAALPASLLADLSVWGLWPDWPTLAGGAVVVLACVMSERVRQPAMPGGNTWRPSGPSGKATTERTAESGSGP